MKCAANHFAQHAIGVADRVVGDGVQLGGIDLAVLTENGFVGADVNHPSHQTAGVGVVGEHLALQSHEQFAEFVENAMDGERKMLCILAPAKGSKQIMEDVNREVGLTSPANGILFALPTEKAFKI